MFLDHQDGEVNRLPIIKSLILSISITDIQCVYVNYQGSFSVSTGPHRNQAKVDIHSPLLFLMALLTLAVSDRMRESVCSSSLSKSSNILYE